MAERGAPYPVVAGALAVVLVLAVEHGRNFLFVEPNSRLLALAERWGWVSEPEGLIDQWSVPVLFALTDASALHVVLGFGLYLAFVAMMLALRAEARGEDNLYPAAGMIASGMAIVVANFWCGIATLLGGYVLTLFIRVRRRRPRDRRSP